MVDGGGNIYEGRGFNVEGAHTLGYNGRGYATCFVGDFTSERPTEAALKAVQDHIKVARSLIFDVLKAKKKNSPRILW